jgi:hypothetical protein
VKAMSYVIYALIGSESQTNERNEKIKNKR